MGFTFIFITAILHNVYPRLSIQSDAVLAVASVCTSIYFCIRCVGDVTGGCFNPVVALINIPFVTVMNANRPESRDFKEYLAPYLFGTLLGGILAGLFCKHVVMPHVPHYYDAMVNTFKEENAS